MEKLLNLLNEYEEKRIKKINADWKLRVKLLFKPYTKEALTNQAYQSVHNEIISKYYWFINRLVRNNKIKATDIVVKFQDEINQFMHPYMTYDNYVNMFVMLLSIQERPIDFLISVLK